MLSLKSVVRFASELSILFENLHVAYGLFDLHYKRSAKSDPTEPVKKVRLGFAI